MLLEAKPENCKENNGPGAIDPRIFEVLADGKVLAGDPGVFIFIACPCRRPVIYKQVTAKNFMKKEIEP
jgi:hypothetical protein